MRKLKKETKGKPRGRSRRFSDIRKTGKEKEEEKRRKQRGRQKREERRG